MRKAVLWLVVAALATSAMAQNIGLSPAGAKKAEAYFHFSMARILDQQEEWDDSIKEYKKALEFTPNDPDIYTAMARTYLGQRNREEAIRAAEKAVELNRNSIGAHRLLAEIHVGTLQAAQGRNQASPAMLEAALKSAIQEYEEILRIDPRGRETYIMLASLYRFSDSPEKSAEIYNKLLGIEPGSEEAVVGLASLAIASDRNSEAVEILMGFLKRQPNSERAWEMLGDAFSSLGDTTGAADAYGRAAALSDDPELRDKLASALLEDNRLNEAAKIYEEILKEDQGSIEILQRLGQIYRRQMKYAEAREVLNRALSRSRNNSVQVRVELVMLDRDEGNFETALRNLETLLRESEKTSYTQRERASRAFFYTHVGLLNSLLTRFDQAVAAFNNVRALTDPGDRARVDLMIADTYRSAKDLDRAQIKLQDALKESPGNRDVQVAYADLIADRGRVDEGMQILQKLADGKEPDLELLSSMTSMYERASRFSDAQRILDTAQRRFAGEKQVHFLQGALYERQKKFAEAEQAFRKALELDQNNPSVLNYLGYMLADSGRNLDEALQMIQKAVDADPINGAFLDSLGWVYFKMDKLDLAERFLKRAVAFAATNATMHDHLGDLYYKTGRVREAQASWTKGLQYADDPDEARQIQTKLGR